MAVTLCPIALAVGCRRCPAFKVCPLKAVIGDLRPEAIAPPPTPPGKRDNASRPARRGGNRSRAGHRRG